MTAPLLPAIDDATVRLVDRLPGLPPGLTQGGPHWQAAPGAYLLTIPDVGRYLVQRGETIDIEIAAGAEPAAVRLFLLGNVRAALLHQRGELPLHAATLVPPMGKEAVALCGPSGMGKSTLAAELAWRGWRMVADDLTRVTMSGAAAIAWPGEARIKLWRDACDRLGLDIASLERVRRDMDKFFVPAASIPEPVRLRAVVRIDPSPEPGLRPAERGAALALLSENALRPRQIAALGMTADHLRVVAAVAGAVEVFHLGGGQAQPPAALAHRIEAMFV